MTIEFSIEKRVRSMRHRMEGAALLPEKMDTENFIVWQQTAEQTRFLITELKLQI